MILMAFLRPFMVSSLLVSTSTLAGAEPAFAGRCDHQCQAYKSHGSVAVCVQWMQRKLGSIGPGKCYEWQVAIKEKIVRLRKGNASHETRVRPRFVSTHMQGMGVGPRSLVSG